MVAAGPGQQEESELHQGYENHMITRPQNVGILPSHRNQ